jgi:calcineurin-like phosphoesterase family protein
MARFFSSDHHFDDDRFNLFYRPFKTVQEQEDYLVERWNSVVGPDDEVYHIGDFATTDRGLEVVSRLNGTIHLIMGNYDDPRPLDRLNELFFSVKNSCMLTLTNGRKVILNHYPSRASRYEFNIVGHIHGLWKVQRNMINVSCDAWHFTPVSEDQIIFSMNAIEKFYDDNVFAGELDCNLMNRDGLEVYAEDEIPRAGKKVFLAGPTPRTLDVNSWRPKMIEMLRKAGYREHILIPEKRSREDGYDYDTQVQWEDEALNAADLIVFWVPRDLESMPGFTTNIEFGEWMKSGKVILGFPEEASGMRYMDKKATKYRIPTFSDMDDVCDCVMEWLYE